MAQEVFSGRIRYGKVVQDVTQATGLNLDQESEGVRQTTYSTANQHGRAVKVLTEAIQQADRQSRRLNPSYQRNLVDAIYDRRIAYVAGMINEARRVGDLQKAHLYNVLIINRYPSERPDALQYSLIK